MRRHLFEIEDQRWCPSWLRNYATDYLRHIVELVRPYDAVLDRLEHAVPENRQIVDLGSGAGGGWRTLLPTLSPDITVTFTDLYPNLEALGAIEQAFPDRVRVHVEPVDSRSVSLHGLRTMFLSFHHMRPDDAQQILADAMANDQPVAIFELTHRDIGQFIAVLFSWIAVLVLTPFIRPFSIGRLVATYVVPLVPAVVVFDGCVSVLRSYTASELREMIASVDPTDRYVWDVGREGKVPVYFCIGTPGD